LIRRRLFAAIALCVAAAPVALAQSAVPQPLTIPQTAPTDPVPAAAPPPGEAEGAGEAMPPQEDVPPPEPTPVPRAGQSKPVPPPPPPTVPTGPQAVVLQGLDKVTARISTIEVPVGGAAKFGSLTIVARACQKSPPEEPPEAAAFLEVTETPASAPPVSLFSGWMFASSPALSALEHPVYDVWVKDCKALAPGTP
jgi:hypothetical protein